MDAGRIHRTLTGPGIAGALAFPPLKAASGVYGAAVRRRNAGFDSGRRAVHEAGVPVVSVGNLTCGGTGKTPVVAAVCDLLAAAGRRPAVLSRGYKSLPGEGANDEKLLLDALLPGVPHVQNPDRAAGARVAVGDHGADVLVLDDGFQHRRLGRDLDVVLVDATAPFGPGSLRRAGCRGELLPLGLLREPPAGLRRAGLVLITRADAVSERDIGRVTAAVRAHAPGVPVGRVSFPAVELAEADGGVRPVRWARGRRVVGLCGIGNPAGFRATLAGLGCDLAAFTARPDHHHHTPAEVAAACGAAVDAGASAVLCTEKDLVKLRTRAFAGFVPPLPVLAVRTAAAFADGGTLLRAALHRVAPPVAVRRAA